MLALRLPRNPSGPELKLVKGSTDRLSLQTKAIEERMKATGESFDIAMMALATSQPELFAEVG